MSLPLCSERSVFTNLAHGFFFSDAELRDSNEEMRRKGKDPCILGQFLASPLLENPGEEKKKKKISVTLLMYKTRAEKKAERA